MLKKNYQTKLLEKFRYADKSGIIKDSKGLAIPYNAYSKYYKQEFMLFVFSGMVDLPSGNRLKLLFMFLYNFIFLACL
jgi:hypothetical protein